MSTYEALKKLNNFSLFNHGYSIDNLYKDFIKNNKLKNPKFKMDTTKGKFVFWDKDSCVVLYSESTPFEDSGTFHNYMGGDGRHSYTICETKYFLEGILNGKKLELEAEISSTQDYLWQKQRNPCFAAKPVENGELEIEKQRNDNNKKYWFVTEPKNNISTKKH